MACQKNQTFVMLYTLTTVVQMCRCCGQSVVSRGGLLIFLWYIKLIYIKKQIEINRERQQKNTNNKTCEYKYTSILYV